jgi:hypothetical protein
METAVEVCRPGETHTEQAATELRVRRCGQPDRDRE